MANELEVTFKAAATWVGSKDAKKKPGFDTNEHKLEFYGLYKQGTDGDNTKSQPWAVQLEAKAKWDAHEKCKGMSKDEAMQKYVEKAKEVGFEA